jgi:hypothetical protein
MVQIRSNAASMVGGIGSPLVAASTRHPASRKCDAYGRRNQSVPGIVVTISR